MNRGMDIAMSATQTVMARIRQNQFAPAIFWQGKEYSYAEFLDMVRLHQRLSAYSIGQGVVCGVLGDYSPQTCALFFALMKTKAILVPFSNAAEPEMPGFLRLAGVQRLFRFDVEDHWDLETFRPSAQRFGGVLPEARITGSDCVHFWLNRRAQGHPS